jgi:CMP-N,N'-diacetyllegionaminic acid synthase
MRILAIIPARGGSKRILKKNIRLLGNRPLIVWSIDVAKKIPEICDILVSTDDSITLEISKKAGALGPWLRPAELATDTTSSIDVVLHALEWYEAAFGEVDGVLLLQPTSPFRSNEIVSKGIELFRNNKYKTVLGVSKAQDHPFWTFKLENESLMPYFSKEELSLRSQDLPLAYVINGSFYLAPPQMLKKYKSFIMPNAIPLIMNNLHESLDIDTEEDWNVAENSLLSIDFNTYGPIRRAFEN